MTAVQIGLLILLCFVGVVISSRLIIQMKYAAKMQTYKVTMDALAGALEKAQQRKEQAGVEQVKEVIEKLRTLEKK